MIYLCPCEGAILTLGPFFSQNGTNFFINNASFVPPTVPVLLQIMSGASTAQDLLPSGSIYSLPSNSTIELSFPATNNAPGGPHPFHLHGVSRSYIRAAPSSNLRTGFS